MMDAPGHFHGVWNYARGLLAEGLDLLFPQSCIFCEGERNGSGPFLCSLCREEIHFIDSPICNRCGQPAEIAYNYPHENFECAKCRKKKPWFDQARSLGTYDSVLRQLIHHFKYNNQPGIMEEISLLMERYFNGTKENYYGFHVLPVPLHVNKIRERGFDQSYLIARGVAELLDLPVADHWMKRIKETVPQASLKRNERNENVRNAFQLMEPEQVRGKNILLVDDVFTTGMTTNEVSRTLKKCKAERVLVFTLARA